jgi:hypothetical protein
MLCLVKWKFVAYIKISVQVNRRDRHISWVKDTHTNVYEDSPEKHNSIHLEDWEVNGRIT